MTEADKLGRLVAGMMDKTAKSLGAARMLLEHGLYDDSTSRAYYAMFHAASALLLTKGLSSSKHKGVISLFDLHFVKPGIAPRETSAVLHKAFRARQVADYGDEAVSQRTEAESTLADAEDFVARIRQLLGGGPDESGSETRPSP